jgi:hypothetical protein
MTAIATNRATSAFVIHRRRSSPIACAGEYDAPVRARDVAALIGFGLLVLVLMWGMAAALVSAGWVLPPGEDQPIQL